MPVTKTELLPIRSGDDVVRVRQQVRTRAVEIGLGLVDQTKIVTAASELARNTLDYGGGGTVRLDVVQEGARRGLRLCFEDQGPGIPDIAQAPHRQVHDGRRPRPRPRGSQTALQRVPHRVDCRRRDPHHHRALEVSMISVPVTEASQVADVRRRAVDMARALGFDETASGRAAIVTTELATNLVKYGAPGEMLLSSFEDDTGTGLQIVALDTGTGLANIQESMRDGHSTGGSAGTGLGSARRQSQVFDIASWPGKGTAILARIQAREGAETSASAPASPRFGAVAVPLRGEPVCGDAFCVRLRRQGWTVLLADGLGHGVHAAEASDQAVRLFRNHEDKSPGEILGAVHAGLRHTRGGAVSVARYDPARGVVTFAGIGNVAGAVVTGRETKRMVSLAGTAGHVARRLQEFEYPFGPDALLVMHSDGITTGWSLDGYPGVTHAHPGLVAAILYRDFARGRDDATVVVAGGLPT